jgi:fructosamine-3-kinase
VRLTNSKSEDPGGTSNKPYEQACALVWKLAERFEVTDGAIISATNAVLAGTSPSLGQVIIKASTHHDGAEAQTLIKLKQAGGVCPEVFHWGENPDWIAMSYLEKEPGRPKLQDKLNLLCQLHAISDTENIPHPTDLVLDRTLHWIFPTLIENNLIDDPMLNLASEVVVNSSRNHIVHGDAHKNNFLLTTDGQTALYDPLGFLGDPELDFACIIWSYDTNADTNFDAWLSKLSRTQINFNEVLFGQWLAIRMLNSVAVSLWQKEASEKQLQDLVDRASFLL